MSTTFKNVVGEVAANAEYQRALRAYELLDAESKEAMRWYEATDIKAHRIESLKLREQATKAAREMSEIAEAIVRRVKAPSSN